MKTADAWPLVLYGPSGVGKSALAETLACRLEVPCRRMTGDEFRRQFLAAVATRSMTSFQSKLRDSQLLLLDDLSIPAGEQALARELVQILDFFRENRRPLMITLTQPPWMAQSFPPALRSRLSEGLAIEIRRPGLAARRAIVSEILQHLNLQVGHEDMDWLVNALPATAPMIRHGLSRIALAVTESSSADRHRLTRQQMNSCLPTNQSLDLDWQIRQIVRLVARQLDQRVADITGKSRRQEVVRARALAMYLVRKLVSATYREIGQGIGKRDPSTVRHACRQMAETIPQDATLREAVDQITDRFVWLRENRMTQEENLFVS